MKNYKKTNLKTVKSACQSDISDSESWQILVMVIMVTQNKINSESKLFEIKLQLLFPADVVFRHQ